MAVNCTHRWVAAQSVFYHLYNQVSYMSLDQISPLTFSIGNTMKRISVIVSSIIIFKTPVQPINALGAAIAILGTFLYSQVFCCSLHLLNNIAVLSLSLFLYIYIIGIELFSVDFSILEKISLLPKDVFVWR